MITEINISNLSIHASGVCMTDAGVWFVHGRLGVLLFYDKKCKKITFYRTIPNVKFDTLSLFRGMTVYKDKIFLIPNNADSIIVYNILEDCFEKIVLKNPIKGMFVNAYTKGRFLYCFPFWYDRIVKIDMETYDIVYGESWRTKINDINNMYYVNASCWINENEIAGVVCKTNIILVYNLETEKWEIKNLESEDKSYTQIASAEGSIYIYDNRYLKIKKIDIEHCKILYEKKIGCTSTKLYGLQGGGVVLDPVNENCWYIYDEKLNLCQYNETKIREKKSSLDYDYCCGCWTNDYENTYCIDTENHFISIHKSGEINVAELHLDYKEWIEICKHLKPDKEDIKVSENEFFSLRDLIYSEAFSEKEKNNTSINCGNSIFQLLKNNL